MSKLEKIEKLLLALELEVIAKDEFNARLSHVREDFPTTENK